MDIDEQNRGFRDLDPSRLLDAVESAGYITDGRVLTLNSYENRVFQVGLDNAEPVVAKFYRPGRWSDETINEEHQFTLELAAEELPVVAPIEHAGGATLMHHEMYRFAVYPRRGGRSPDLDNADQLEQLGRFVARIHNIGARKLFDHRPQINLDTYCIEPAEYLVSTGLVPNEVRDAYQALIITLTDAIRECEQRAGDVELLRLHSDCHWGNILWRDDTPHIVDFDDARNGPSVQDLWMFLPGERPERVAAIQHVLEGYTQFRDFNVRELHMLEAMRTLRLIYFSAWVGRRWDDPAFPIAFSWFGNDGWWREHIQTLHEQIAAMADEPLPWGQPL